MSDIELHNSYKCYDSIPTPPDESKQFKHHQHQQTITFSDNLIRCASLDSLVNLSDQNNSSDELSDSDSLSELKDISSPAKVIPDKPRKSDIEEIKNIEPPKDPVIKAFLENSHKTCDYENCGYKKENSTVSDKNKLNEQQSTTITQQQHLNSPISISNQSVLKNIRRNSDSIRRMETILEEPIEPKISVKEILARFETMRETAEVKFVLIGHDFHGIN